MDDAKVTQCVRALRQMGVLFSDQSLAMLAFYEEEQAAHGAACLLSTGGDNAIMDEAQGPWGDEDLEDDEGGTIALRGADDDTVSCADALRNMGECEFGRFTRWKRLSQEYDGAANPQKLLAPYTALSVPARGSILWAARAYSRISSMYTSAHGRARTVVRSVVVASARDPRRMLSVDEEEDAAQGECQTCEHARQVPLHTIAFHCTLPGIEPTRATLCRRGLQVAIGVYMLRVSLSKYALLSPAYVSSCHSLSPELLVAYVGMIERGLGIILQ